MKTENSSAQSTNADPVADLKERIAAAKAKKEQVNASRVADPIASLQSELAQAEREAQEACALQEAESKYGARKIATVETDEGIVILKAANHIAFKRFQDLGKTNHDDLMALVMPCVVYPSKAAFESLNNELPATLARCALAVYKLAGARRDDLSGK